MPGESGIGSGGSLYWVALSQAPQLYALQNYHCSLSFFQQVMGWQRQARWIPGEETAQAVCQHSDHFCMRRDCSSLPGECTDIGARETVLDQLSCFGWIPACFSAWAAPRFLLLLWPALGRICVQPGSLMHCSGAEQLPMQLAQPPLCHPWLVH